VELSDDHCHEKEAKLNHVERQEKVKHYDFGFRVKVLDDNLESCDIEKVKVLALV